MPTASPPLPPVQADVTIEVVSGSGDVTVRGSNGTDPPQPIGAGGHLYKTQEISTGVDVEIVISFPDGSKMQVPEMTQLLVDDLLYKGSRQAIAVQLKLGEIAAQVNPKHAFQTEFKVTTPAGTTSSRGTKFTVAYAPASKLMTVSVTEHAVIVTPINKSLRPVTLRAGQQVEVTPDHIGPATPIAPPAPATAVVPSPAFDGTWSIAQVCPLAGSEPGYATEFIVQVSGGSFHGQYGVPGQPGSEAIDGMIAADGTVSIKASSLIGDKARSARPGIPFVYDVAGHIGATGGTGKRLSARACDWTFAKQQGPAPDISGNWLTADGRIVEITQNGNQVSWTACCKPGHENLVVSVSGMFDGKHLVGTYHYREGSAEGSGTAVYVLAGDRLEGTWTAPDGTTESAALIRRRGEAVDDLAGKWTTVSGHTVNLIQNGDQVSWTTCCRQSHPNWVADITSTFDGKNLVGIFHWRDGERQGNGTVMYVLKGGTQLEGELDTPGKEPYHSMLTRQADSSLSGKWTSQSGSTITLTQTGNQVTGSNCCRQGHPDFSGDVAGTFDGKNFVGVFHYRDGDDRGTGTFIYTLVDGRLEGSSKVIGGTDQASVLTRQTSALQP